MATRIVDLGSVVGPPGEPGTTQWDGITDKPITFPPAAHNHAAGDLASGTLDSARLPIVPVNKGGTGRATLTSGYFLRGNGASAVTMTAPSSALSAMGGLPLTGGTMTGALYAKDDAAYTTAKVRNVKFGSTDLTAGTSSLASGQIAIIYE